MKRRWVAVIAALVLAVGVGAVLANGRRRETREVRVVVRDMAYYVNGGREPNPTLRFRAGERVRISIRNEDAGYEHNFVAPALGLRTALLRAGGRDEVLVTVPDTAGTSVYHCGPHAEMMRGNIAIE
jgi:plastocyanin